MAAILGPSLVGADAGGQAVRLRDAAAVDVLAIDATASPGRVRESAIAQEEGRRERERERAL